MTYNQNYRLKKDNKMKFLDSIKSKILKSKMPYNNDASEKNQLITNVDIEDKAEITGELNQDNNPINIKEMSLSAGLGFVTGAIAGQHSRIENLERKTGEFESLKTKVEELKAKLNKVSENIPVAQENRNVRYMPYVSQVNQINQVNNVKTVKRALPPEYASKINYQDYINEMKQ
jgi:hypothetical protein